MMGWHKPTLPHPDDAALRVAAEILAGGRSSRLVRRLVDEEQIAASVECDAEYPGSRWDNLFLLEALPRAPHTSEELEGAIWEELERLQREPVGERELAKAKNRLRAARVRELTSNHDLAVQLAYFQAAHGDWRILLELDRKIQEVSAEDILRAARATFRRTNTVVATLVKPPVEYDPRREEEGRAIVARMVEALGGEEVLGGIRAVRIVSQWNVQTPGGGSLPASVETLLRIPDRVRSESRILGRVMTQGIGPEGPWASVQGRARSLEGEEARELRAGLERDVFVHAFPAAAQGYRLQAREPEGELDVVEVRGPSGAAFTVYVERSTGLPRKIFYQGRHPMTGEPAEFAEEFSDFREIAGGKHPYHVTTYLNGERFAETEVTELTVNGAVSEEQFARPRAGGG